MITIILQQNYGHVLAVIKLFKYTIDRDKIIIVLSDEDRTATLFKVDTETVVVSPGKARTMMIMKLY